MIALLLALLLQNDPLEAEVDAIIASMRRGIAERKTGTDKLFELRRKQPRVLRFLRLRANEEKDVRIRVRLEYVAGTRMLLWTWETDVAATTSVAACDEGIAMNRGEATVFLDANTGQKKWEHKTGAWKRPPLFAGGRAFIVLDAAGYRPLRIVDIATGRMRQGPGLMPEPAVPMAAGGGCVALNLADGKVKFGRADLKKTFQVAAPLRSRFALAADRLYAYDGDATMYALDAATGKKLWQAETDQGLDFFGATDAVVVTRCTRDRIRVHDAATGKDVWKEDVPDEETRPPLILLDKVCISVTPQAVCRDLATGKTLWKAETASKDKPPVQELHVVGAHAFYAQSGGAHALHLQSGRVEALDLPDMGAIVRVTARGAMLYAFTQEGKVVAFKVMP